MPFTIRVLAGKYFTVVTPLSATRAKVERKTLKIELTRSLENVLTLFCNKVLSACGLPEPGFHRVKVKYLAIFYKQ